MRVNFLPIPLLAFLLQGPGWGQAVTTQTEGNNVKVLIDGQLFTEYRGESPKPSLYPIVGPNGVNITRDFPFKKVDGQSSDHPHHRGLFFAHGEVNDVDYWKEGGDAGTIVHEKFSDMATTENAATFVAHSKWTEPDGDVVLKDARTIRVEKRADGARVLDISISLTAVDDDVEFGDTKEGTMAVRVADSIAMEPDGLPAPTGPNKPGALNSEGLKNKKVWGQQSKWTSFFGPDASNEIVAVTLFDHPSSFRAPTYWHARDYGLLAANPFGIHDFKKVEEKTGMHELAEGETLKFRYRLLLSKGKPDAAALAAEAEAWSKQ
jgi:hypothetical protein